MSKLFAVPDEHDDQEAWDPFPEIDRKLSGTFLIPSVSDYPHHLNGRIHEVKGRGFVWKLHGQFGVVDNLVWKLPNPFDGSESVNIW